MPGRFKLDENLPRDAKALLLAAGHNVESAIDERQMPKCSMRVASKAEYSLRRISISLTFGFIHHLFTRRLGFASGHSEHREHVVGSQRCARST